MLAVADRVAARIGGGDLPPGSWIDPAVNARLSGCSRRTFGEALAILAERGVVAHAVRNGRPAWQVPRHAPTTSRELVLRGRPMLLGLARMAADRGNPAARDALLAARALHLGIDGPGDLDARSQGYEAFLLILADLTGSAWMRKGVHALLDESRAMRLATIAGDIRLRLPPNTDGDMMRLARAIGARDPEGAVVAMDDHLLLVLHRFERDK